MPGSFCALSYDLQTCETCQKISGAGIPLKPNKDGDEKCTTNPPLAFMINGCAIYVDSTKCKVCKQDFILATDGTCYDRQAYNGLGPNDYCIEATT